MVTPQTAFGRFIRRKAARNLLIGVIIMCAILFGDGLFGRLTSGDRVAPEVYDTTAPYYSVVVILPFEPERFHIERLSAKGVFGGRDGEPKRIRLLRVTDEQLRGLSYLPWVDRIEPMP
jgi:hypothetical protein